MVKDRLKEYIAAVANEGGDVGIDVIGEKTPLTSDDASPFQDDLEDFFKQLVEIRASIELIIRTVENVKRSQTAILVAPQAKPEMREELEGHMNTVRTLSLNVQKSLKQIEAKIKDDEQTNQELEAIGKRRMHWADLRIRKTQHATLLQRFTDIMTQFNDSQIQYRDGCKSRIQRSVKVVNPKNELTDDQIEDALEQGDFNAFTQSFLVDVQMAKQDLQELQDRHTEILKLEKNIQELHNMFVDIAMLVQQQGEMVDRVEANVYKAVEYVEDAVKQTGQAVVLRKKVRRKKIFIIICVVISVIVLAIIITLAVVLR